MGQFPWSQGQTPWTWRTLWACSSRADSRSLNFLETFYLAHLNAPGKWAKLANSWEPRKRWKVSKTKCVALPGFLQASGKMCPWRFAATSAMAFQQWSWTASSTDLVWLGEQCMPKTVCWADPKGNRFIHWIQPKKNRIAENDPIKSNVRLDFPGALAEASTKSTKPRKFRTTQIINQVGPNRGHDCQTNTTALGICATHACPNLKRSRSPISKSAAWHWGVSNFRQLRLQRPLWSTQFLPCDGLTWCPAAGRKFWELKRRIPPHVSLSLPIPIFFELGKVTG